MFFTNKVHSESWSSTSVSPSVVAALAYFGASLPTFIAACHASSSPQALMYFLLKGSLSIKVDPFPSQATHLDLVQLQDEQLPLKNCAFLEGNQTSLQKLRNPLWQPAGLQDCTILPANHPNRICTNFPSSRLFNPGFAQIWAGVSCSTQKLCKPLGKPVQLPAINAHFSPAVEQSLTCATELTSSLRD